MSGSIEIPEVLASWEVIAQGAEGRIYKGSFFNRPAVVKERFPKLYRLEALDKKLSTKRLTQEVRSMQRCRKLGIHTPCVYHVDFNRNWLCMEYVDARPVKAHVFEASPEDGGMVELGGRIGAAVASMHDGDVIHGDLTTSNMLLRADGTLCFIDFGLSYVSTLPEDKAVDLFVLERAFLSTHPKSDAMFARLLAAYGAASKRSRDVLNRLEDVRMRGRKKLQLG
eukprot:tig00020830_g14383.t1